MSNAARVMAGAGVESDVRKLERDLTFPASPAFWVLTRNAVEVETGTRCRREALEPAPHSEDIGGTGVG